MPYNNTPITPTKEITGTVALPLARVKKIIATDDDISNCSNNAAFVITVAAEMFLQHLVEQSYNIVKSERKPRRNIQYRDVANAVSRVENLEFLTDVVPKTTTYRQHKQKQRQQALDPTGEQQEDEAPPAVPAPRSPNQTRITVDGQVIRPEVPQKQIAEVPAQATSGPAGLARPSEAQATNGARHEDDVMDVDANDEGSMHTARDGRTESLVDEEMES